MAERDDRGMAGVRIEAGAYGRRAVLTSVWTGPMARYLRDQDVVELELNDGKGWRPTELSFLRELPQLRVLEILALGANGVEPIHDLHELRTLTLFTYCRSEIRFGAFPHLDKCAIEWRPKARSLFDSTKLRELFVNRYKGASTDEFARLSNLESLAILNAPVRDVGGLAHLVHLRRLRLANLRRLSSLAGIQHLRHLEALDLNTCRSITSIEEIGQLTHLNSLYLNNMGAIDSLRPLSELEHLESVVFYESTNIVDGDLLPLTRLPRLSNISYQNRRHYSHRREDFGAAYHGWAQLS